jgi:hypothetical protein
LRERVLLLQEITIDRPPGSDQDTTVSTRAQGGVQGGNEVAGTPAALTKTERAQVADKGRQAETEAAPIRYVAELLGGDILSECPTRDGASK